MNSIYEGEITSTQLGTFGSKDILYGFIGIHTKDGKHIRIKIDSYTEYDTIEIHAMVRVETQELGNTGILTAKKIELIDKPESTNMAPSTKAATG